VPRLFTVRRSPIHGRGGFAVRPIPAGTRIVEYTGERITPEEAERREPGTVPTGPGGVHHTFLFAIDDDVVVDAGVGGTDARWINHSCAPNCDAVIDGGRIYIEATRDIAPGEELAYDYAYVLPERHTPAAKRRFPCACGAATCRGTLVAKKR
jgi:SET domain-containing protein